MLAWWAVVIIAAAFLLAGIAIGLEIRDYQAFMYGLKIRNRWPG